MKKFHRLGRWSFSLGISLGVASPCVIAQERGAILPAASAFGTSYQETHEGISFLLALAPHEAPLLVFLPKMANDAALAQKIGGEISLWNLPKQEGDAPVALLSFFQAQLVTSFDGSAQGLALFLQFDERAEQTASLLFAWNPLAGTQGAFEPVGPLPEIVLSYLSLPPTKDPEQAPIPPPPDFAAVFGEEVGHLLDGMYRVASSGDPDSVHAFLALFLQLPPEVQNWLVNFIVQTLLMPESPFAPLAQYVEDYVAPAYTSYLENQAALAGAGSFAFAVEPAVSTERLEALAAEASFSTDEEGANGSPVALQEQEEERGTSPFDSALLAALGSMQATSLARDAWNLEGEDISRQAGEKGSRIGLQEISRARGPRNGVAAGNALDRFLAGFRSEVFPVDAAHAPFPQLPSRVPKPRDGEDLSAVELRRRVVAHARRAA